MKKIIISLFLVLALCAVATAEAKIAVVDMQKVVTSTKSGSKVLKQLEGYQTAKETEGKKMQAELQALQKELASPALNADTRAQKQRQLEDKKISFKRFVRDAQKELDTRSQKELFELQKKLFPLVKAMGKSKGYIMVLDITNQGVFYYDTSIDITQDVIKMIDEKLPAN